MPNPFEEMKKSSQADLPNQWHSRVMQRVFIMHFKKMFIVGVVLVSLSILSSGWYLWEKIMENGVHHLIGMTLKDFEFNLEYVTSFGQIILEASPIRPIIIFVINFVIGIYLIFTSLKMSRAFTAKNK